MKHSQCGGTGVVPVVGGGAMTCLPCCGTGQVSADADFVRRPILEGLDCPEPFDFNWSEAQRQEWREGKWEWPRL